METRLHRLAAWALVIFCCLPFLAFGQVTVQLQVLPPYSPYLSDYTSRPKAMVIIVINASAQPQSIYFTGSVTGDNGVSAQTKANYKPSQALRVAPGSSSFTGTQLSPMFNWDMGTLQGVNTQEVQRSGLLPQGNYRICVDVRDYQTGNIIGTLQPSACSQPINIAYAQPPVNLNPPCGTQLANITSGQQIPFSWSTIFGANMTSVQYNLKIMEMVPGMRSPGDALLSATAPTVVDINTTSNTYLLNSALLGPPPLNGDKKFAYAITATDMTGRGMIANRGMSEPCYFIYGSRKKDTGVSAINFGGKVIIDTTLPSGRMDGTIACGGRSAVTWTNNTDYKYLVLNILNEGDCPASCAITMAGPPSPPGSTGRTVSPPAPAVPSPQSSNGRETIQVFNAPPKGGSATFTFQCGAGRRCNFLYHVSGANDALGAANNTYSAPAVHFDSNSVTHSPGLSLKWSRCQTTVMTLLEIASDIGADLTVAPMQITNDGTCKIEISVVGIRDVVVTAKGGSVVVTGPGGGNFVVKKGKKLTIKGRCNDTEQADSNCAGTISSINMK